MGFFASVGPLSIFTSTHLLPVEYKFVADSNPPEFASPEASLTPGSKVRLRIVGTRVDANEIVSSRSARRCSWMSNADVLDFQFAIGTMKEDFLGPID
jgi:DNA-directed RNA polymerase II subunit RPB7